MTETSLSVHIQVLCSSVEFCNLMHLEFIHYFINFPISPWLQPSVFACTSGAWLLKGLPWRWNKPSAQGTRLRKNTKMWLCMFSSHLWSRPWKAVDLWSSCPSCQPSSSTLREINGDGLETLHMFPQHYSLFC